MKISLKLYFVDELEIATLHHLFLFQDWKELRSNCWKKNKQSKLIDFLFDRIWLFIPAECYANSIYLSFMLMKNFHKTQIAVHACTKHPLHGWRMGLNTMESIRVEQPKFLDLTAWFLVRMTNLRTKEWE